MIPIRFAQKELSIAKKPMFLTLVRAFSRQAALLFTNFREATVSTVFTSLLQNDTLTAGFLNLEHLGSIALVLPITTATVQL